MEIILDNKEDSEEPDKESDTNETSDDLSNLLKSFTKIDNYVVKYIYEKYIEKKSGTKGESKNVEAYNQFLHTIFSLERPAIITQKESLETDLQNMEIADEAYEKDPKNFKTRQFDSLPDVKRCSFIRKHKNKYKRCANGLLDDDSDMCYKHINSSNMYWDSFCKITEEIIKNE
jgi:hypothetical protein